jgi:nicotinate-nucleotide adenylyltransferase
MTRRPALAIFGGSFDPPHLGHVLLAHYALAATNVTEVIVAPTYTHAFGKDLTHFDHRMAMAKLAFADLARVRVDPIERQLGGTSRTFRLVEQLALRYPHHDLHLLIGADILLEAEHWQRFEEVKRMAPLIVAGRSGFSHPDLDPNAPCLPAISSSAVRSELLRGESVRTRVPAQVLTYIEKHGLYRAESSS